MLFFKASLAIQVFRRIYPETPLDANGDWKKYYLSLYQNSSRIEDLYKCAYDPQIDSNGIATNNHTKNNFKQLDHIWDFRFVE
jgi:hypothetical protein